MKDEIIRMAKEAGFSEAWLTAGANPPHFDAPAVIVEHFYNLAVQHEREECAKLCDEVSLQALVSWKLAYHPEDQGREMSADECAHAIRARGEKQ